MSAVYPALAGYAALQLWIVTDPGL